VDQLLQQAVQLPKDQRLTLALRLLAMDEPAESADTEQAWDTEIRERIARYDAGQTTARPAEQVFADLDRRLRP
jgi:putative addiction module component (TIGR02574 family)